MKTAKKVVILTGATSGIGREAVWGLAAGHTLVLPVRNKLKGEVLRQQVLKEIPEANIDIMPCDMASFQSIKAFVRNFKRKYKSLHVLINNAGIWETKNKLSKDGIELTFAVNHLAPFLLTGLLLDTLIQNAPARIIVTSSRAHRRGIIHWDDLELKKKYSHRLAYCQSKLTNILFTKKLSQKLKGTGVTANCFHPGLVHTALFNKMPFVRFLLRPFMISPKKGAQTLLYLATSPDVQTTSGGYFENNQQKKPSKSALRKDYADRLWKISEEYIKVPVIETIKPNHE